MTFEQLIQRLIFWTNCTLGVNDAYIIVYHFTVK